MALVKSILFVDGENLTIGFQSMIDEQGRTPLPQVVHRRDVFVWNRQFNGEGIAGINTDILRVNYYTSAHGDDPTVNAVREEIASNRYNVHGDFYGSCQLHPRVYKKEARSRKSRLVDINITIDVMRHAYTDAVDVIYLFSGDGDFLELVAEVARRGKKICLGAFSSGLEPRLRSAVDRFILLDNLFLAPVPPPEIAAPEPKVEPIQAGA
jgi:uncharacterized LabA/DUF88 family protein